MRQTEANMGIHEATGLPIRELVDLTWSAAYREANEGDVKQETCERITAAEIRYWNASPEARARAHASMYPIEVDPDQLDQWYIDLADEAAEAGDQR